MIKKLLSKLSLKRSVENNAQQNIINSAMQELSDNQRLSDAEKAFINAVYEKVQLADIDTDYQALAQNSPSDNIEFWYELSVALMTLPYFPKLDVRDNGRLQTANVILTKIIGHSYKVAPFWANKIAVLDYLITGYTELQQETKKEQYINEILTATSQAQIYFPNEQWFDDKRQEVLQKFGSVPQ